MEDRIKSIVERETDYLLYDLLNRQNHILLYGEHELTTAILRSFYEKAKERQEFLCSWHDASKINQPMDFFEPILRLKYRDEYESLREKPWFKNYVTKNDRDGVFQFASLCGREKDSENSNARKLPLIFIDGIEDLFFKRDYCHLDDEGIKKLLFGKWFEQPLSLGFGDCLRGHLHHTGNGIFYGIVRDKLSLQFNATLGNYHYLFFEENFMSLNLGDLI